MQKLSKPNPINQLNLQFRSEFFNITNLTMLIQSEIQPESIKHFLPISLCNVVYKVITKVLMNRLKSCIAKLVNLFKASFVSGCQVVDNIIITQEIVHSIRRSKARKGGMMFKLDIEKAYDRVNWELLMETLEIFGFSFGIRKLIKTCVTTSTLAVLWNDERTKELCLSRGLRQGDPLSPYLFVLYLERLSMLVNAVVESKCWQIFDVCRGA